MPIGPTELENRFSYHPATKDTAPQHARVRDECLIFAIWLDDHLPDGRDKAVAFTKLQEVMHWANSAIAMSVPIATDPERART